MPLRPTFTPKRLLYVTAGYHSLEILPFSADQIRIVSKERNSRGKIPSAFQTKFSLNLLQRKRRGRPTNSIYG